MKRNFEITTFEEAVDCIKYHFLESEGLIKQIENGEKIDDTDVKSVKIALLRIQEQWKEEDIVDKEIVRLFPQIIHRLDECIPNDIDMESEIRKLAMDLSTWIDQVFTVPHMSEQHAIALVCQHVFGTPPFCVGLRLAQINENSVQELFEALEVLAQVWKNKRYIPKFAAHSVISAPTLVSTTSHFFHGPQKQKLQDIKSNLIILVDSCLS